jgi:hypothetical protein
MLALLAAVTLTVATQVPPPQSPPAGAQVAKQDKKTMMRKDDPKRSPDLDLIGFLGDYGDAADGLDPMGLAENAAAMKASKIAPKPARDAHP